MTSYKKGEREEKISYHTIDSNEKHYVSTTIICKPGKQSLRQRTDLENEPRLDLREWEMRDKLVPTKKGISLRLHQIKVLSDRMEFIEEALRQNEEKKFHLGTNVFVSLRKDNPCVDIRQYWKPPKHNDVVPTKRGLCLRPVEYNHLKTSWEDILKNLPVTIETIT